MPSNVGPTAQTQAIWTALLAILKAEVAPGKRLATIADVRKSIHFWTKTNGPLLGVQPLEWQYLEHYSQHRRIIKVRFLIAVAAFSTESPSRPANLDDALATLQTLLDDGNGNGVEPIIHDPQNILLGGIAAQTNLSRCQYDWQIRPDADQRTCAYGVYDYDVETLVAV